MSVCGHSTGTCTLSIVRILKSPECATTHLLVRGHDALQGIGGTVVEMDSPAIVRERSASCVEVARQLQRSRRADKCSAADD